jgi:DNA-binding transcriptional regulator YhcF (GntR family)
MEWQFHSDTPIYAQLVEGIALRIVTGVYGPGQRLPAVRELAVEAGVNPNTMQRALGELERKGLVYSQRTSGRFVTEDTKMIAEEKRAIATGHVRQFLRAMDQLGLERAEILSLLSTAQAEEEEKNGNS